MGTVSTQIFCSPFIGRAFRSRSTSSYKWANMEVFWWWYQRGLWRRIILVHYLASICLPCIVGKKSWVMRGLKKWIALITSTYLLKLGYGIGNKINKKRRLEKIDGAPFHVLASFSLCSFPSFSSLPKQLNWQVKSLVMIEWITLW